MSRVKSKNTGIELKLRSALHKTGLRYKIHLKGTPGTPDIVFMKKKVAIFVDGDFWHGYRFNGWKNALKPFWYEKIGSNIRRDRRNFQKLRRLGWITIRVWEHQIEADLNRQVERIKTRLNKPG